MQRDCSVFKDKLLKQTCLALARNPLLLDAIGFDGKRNQKNRNRGIRRYNSSRPRAYAAKNRNPVQYQPNGISGNVVQAPILARSAQSSCPIGSSSGTLANQKSLSPWTYEINRDYLRFPNLINFAKCLCDGCIDPATLRQNFNAYSALVTTEITVVRRKSVKVPFSDCKIGVNCNEETLKVPVGCHCMRY